MANSVRVASVQFQHRAGDKAYNIGRVAAFARQAARKGAALVATPEMCICGYWHVPGLDRAELEALSESVPDGPSAVQVRSLAMELGIGIGAGLLERSQDGRLFNSYFVALPDGAIHVHRKLHAFEHDEIASGDRYTVFDTPWGIRAGILICYDNNIIENVRATALLGADLLIAPHQTGGCASRSPHAMTPIDVDIWRNRHRDPKAIEREFRGPKGRGMADAVAAITGPRQRPVRCVQQRRRRGQRRGADRQCHDHRPLWPHPQGDMGGGRQDGGRRPRPRPVAAGNGPAVAQGATAGTLRKSRRTAGLHRRSSRGALLRGAGQAALASGAHLTFAEAPAGFRGA